MHVILRRLIDTDEQSFIDAYNSWETPELAKRWFLPFPGDWNPSMPFADLLTKLGNQRAGVDLAPGFVPCEERYAFTGTPGNEETIVGRLSIRRKLTDALQIYGGHIGYAVLPEYRRKGYATAMLRSSLETCRWFGIREALLTIDKLNYASIAAAKKCGAEFADEFWDADHHRTTQRWTIKL
jgi:predicted acetyltransferase